MYTERPPSQFDRPLHHPRDHHHHHPSPPSREQRPFQPSQNNQQSNKKSSSRGAVPFNRVQLAAALIEYNDHPNHDEASGINWEIQEISHQPVTPIKQAPYSAIFIPFRQTLPSKPLDFFSGLELTSSPKSYPQSLSGFGLVSESGLAKVPETNRPEHKRFSENVVIENTEQIDHPSQAAENDLEVLSEWGLDKVLSGNLTEPGSSSDQPPQGQATSQPQTRQPSSSRPPKHLSERQEVKSDMFDFHFSELRLEKDQDNPLGKTGTTHDFLSGKPKGENLNPVIDDEALLRQRVGCDPEGRTFLRPQSVMELKETQLLYQNPRTRMPSTSKTKQIALARSRAPTSTSQHAAFEDRTKASLNRSRRKSTLRAKSLSPTRVVAPASQPLIANSKQTRQRSASGILQSSTDLLTASIPARTRRKSALDEPSTHRLHIKPLGASQSLSRPASPNFHALNANPDPKPKRRTSADIVERYQKSIALLEGRKSEDMTYDVPNKPGSSVNGSQQGQDAQVPNHDNDSNMLTRAGSTSNSQSEFSLGVPRQFTSRFDPKVASVLSQATPGDLDDEHLDGQSLDGEEGENPGNLQDESLKPIYDEHGRVRFPASLKPMVLIMPIPLTPAQPEPDQVIENDTNAVDSDQIDPLEKAKQEQIEKLKQVRPAGKLYGRSLMDELNSRTATQKSRQISFGANRQTQMFLSPQDASRPGSIYSDVDPVPEMQLRVPNNANSRLHQANQAVRTTQYKFNQALVNSSKARQSVFGMDMVMKAELEKLKKIKAMEEKELQEEEIKMEAKEAKRQAKKWGKKKNDPIPESSKIDPVNVKDQINNRLSRMDNWDAILEREAKPPDLQARYSAALEARATRYFTPLPVLPDPIDSNQNLVSNMDNWFKDKMAGSSDNHTPMISSSVGHDDESDFGNENTLARQLELQVENMKYKPLPNVFESHQMVRPNSVQSQAAFMSVGPSSNTPNPMTTSPRTLAIEAHPDQEEVLELIPETNQYQFLDKPSLQTHEEADDNIPLSQRRKSKFPKFNLEVDEDDNRPLSMIATKRVTKSARSPVQLNPSPNDSDEELPLGIRASILISQKHPPIDLTNDAESSDGPIGSNASDESDLIPLGIRATILQPFSSSEMFYPSPFQSHPNGGRSVSTSSVPAPIISSHKDVGQGYNQAGSHGIGKASSARSIGGQSDDVPLGTMLRQPPPVPAFNPAFSFPNLSPAFNNPFQAAQVNSRSNTAQAPITTSKSDDDDDDIPIGRRITLAPPPPMQKIDKHSDKELDKAGVSTGRKSEGSSDHEDETTKSLEVPHHQRRDKIKLRNPIASQIVVDESIAREDTLAALEGRGNVEEHADDDVPLGVTRAAHSVAANGTLQRERTMKRKMERERKQEANKAKAEWETLMNKGQKEGSVRKENLDHTSSTIAATEDEDEDDDDVPLGMSHRSTVNLNVSNRKQDDSDDDDLPLGIQHPSMNMNLESQIVQRQLMEQQNLTGFGIQPINPILYPPQLQHQTSQHVINPTFINLGSNLSFSLNNTIPQNLNNSLNNNNQSDSNISQWRKDIL